MKKNCLLFFLIICYSCFAQTTEKYLFLKDAVTNLPIEDATVFIIKTKQTLLSNSEGKITFILNGSSNIQVSHSSYISVTVRSSALLKTDNIIYLKSNINDLDEIVVTKKHPQKILKDLIQNSIKKLTVPARLKVYSREFFRQNGTYAYYNDGLMNFQIFGKENNIKSNILVEQNRSFGLVDDYIGSDVLGYNLNDIMQNYYNFKYLEPILESNAKKHYDFIIKGYSVNSDYNVMLVTPLESNHELKDDYKVIYDYKHKIIIEVSSYVSPITISKIKEKSSIGSKNTYKSLFKTIYRFDKLNYYLLSSKEEIGFERIDKNSKTNIEVRNYLVTTNFSNQNYSYKESDLFKDKTLHNKKNVILNNYWEISGLTATEEEQAIVDMIEAKSN